MIKRWIGVLFLLQAIFGTGFSSQPKSQLAANPPPGPDRYTTINVKYTAYTWWVATWSNNTVACSVIVDHKGQPTLPEIYRDCGETVYNKWLVQPPCDKHIKSETCIGYYTFLVSTEPAEKEIPTQLPAATAWLTLDGCDPVASTSTNICENDPTLVITGQEPLPNQTITSIEGTINGEPFSCEGLVCKVPLPETDEVGAPIEFWAWSSYGDSSPVLTAQVRVSHTDQGDPDQLYWYVDVLSNQWQGQPVASCADSWESFPPVGGPPEWLTTPDNSQDLSSDIPYNYLAANLILQGAVDASSCPDGGLMPGNGVNTCGLEAARPIVSEWQNRFDSLILSTAQDTGVPAHLLKNLFARESQFWPGVFRANTDVGLGQLTQNGADTTLIWNRSFFDQFCPLVLSSDACGKGYLHLNEDEQQLMREALVGSVNAACDNCPLGLDLSQADFSVNVFAHTLLANCEQTGRVVRNITGRTPGEVASYEDLWKFTLVNYNAGPGCLAQTLDVANGAGGELTWDSVSPYLVGACEGAIQYVNDISQ